MRQPIYVAAYPKSGSTWLTRLLGDVLNSPTGGSIPAEDTIDVAAEGQDRPGPYIVRRGHFTLSPADTGPVVPESHQLAWKQLTNEQIVFLVRDPRDICVSGAFHWGVTVEQFMDRMIRGDVAGCGRWDDYCNGWYCLGPERAALVLYKKLLSDTRLWVGRLMTRLEIDHDPGRIARVIKRQSFASRKAAIGDDPAELRRNNMRLGIAGDWKNHLSPAMNERFIYEFGWMMEKLGYDSVARKEF